MENFDWTKFTRKIAVKASLSTLYKAWATSSEIEKWFLSNASFFNKEGKKINPDQAVEKDFSYEWRWFLYDDAETGKITEANGTDFLQFTFAGNCLVDIKLTQENGYVLVELTQKNIPTDENSKRDIRLGCHTGWSFYLINLKSVYEGGLDLRNKDENTYPMVNN